MIFFILILWIFIIEFQLFAIKLPKWNKKAMKKIKDGKIYL